MLKIGFVCFQQGKDNTCLELSDGMRFPGLNVDAFGLRAPWLVSKGGKPDFVVIFDTIPRSLAFGHILAPLADWP